DAIAFPGSVALEQQFHFLALLRFGDGRFAIAEFDRNRPAVVANFKRDRGIGGLERVRRLLLLHLPRRLHRRLPLLFLARLGFLLIESATQRETLTHFAQLPGGNWRGEIFAKRSEFVFRAVEDVERDSYRGQVAADAGCASDEGVGSDLLAAPGERVA